MSQGWFIAFIILLIFYGPAYIIGCIVAIGLAFSPGTAGPISTPVMILMVLLFSIPFVYTGYKVLKSDDAVKK